ncbi:UNVERIFIED_ORG: hypothetical protein ABIB52_003621 [Arthrobacter sp. UYCu721]
MFSQVRAKCYPFVGLIAESAWVITWLINRRANRNEGEPVGTQNIGKDDAKGP